MAKRRKKTRKTKERSVSSTEALKAAQDKKRAALEDLLVGNEDLRDLKEALDEYGKEELQDHLDITEKEEIFYDEEDSKGIVLKIKKKKELEDKIVFEAFFTINKKIDESEYGDLATDLALCISEAEEKEVDPEELFSFTVEIPIEKKEAVKIKFSIDQIKQRLRSYSVKFQVAKKGNDLFVASGQDLPSPTIWKAEDFPQQKKPDLRQEHEVVLKFISSNGTAFVRPITDADERVKKPILLIKELDEISSNIIIVRDKLLEELDQDKGRDKEEINEDIKVFNEICGLLKLDDKRKIKIPKSVSAPKKVTLKKIELPIVVRTKELQALISKKIEYLQYLDKEFEGEELGRQKEIDSLILKFSETEVYFMKSLPGSEEGKDIDSEIKTLKETLSSLRSHYIENNNIISHDTLDELVSYLKEIALRIQFLENRRQVLENRDIQAVKDLVYRLVGDWRKLKTKADWTREIRAELRNFAYPKNGNLDIRSSKIILKLAGLDPQINYVEPGVELPEHINVSSDYKKGIDFQGSTLGGTFKGILDYPRLAKELKIPGNPNSPEVKEEIRSRFKEDEEKKESWIVSVGDQTTKTFYETFKKLGLINRKQLKEKLVSLNILPKNVADNLRDSDIENLVYQAIKFINQPALDLAALKKLPEVHKTLVGLKNDLDFKTIIHYFHDHRGESPGKLGTRIITDQRLDDYDLIKASQEMAKKLKETSEVVEVDVTEDEEVESKIIFEKIKERLLEINKVLSKHFNDQEDFDGKYWQTAKQAIKQMVPGQSELHPLYAQLVSELRHIVIQGK